MGFRVRSFVAVDSEVVRCGHDLGDLRVIAMESNVSGPREGENNSFIDIFSVGGGNPYVPCASVLSI